MKNKFKIGDPTTFLVEFEGHAPRAVERKFEMQCVDTAHHGRRSGDFLRRLPAPVMFQKLVFRRVVVSPHPRASGAGQLTAPALVAAIGDPSRIKQIARSIGAYLCAERLPVE